MGWADGYIEALKKGAVSFCPRGNSMAGRIEDGQLITVKPLSGPPEVGDAVLCRVNGRQYLHLVKAIGQDGRLQIGNNRGHINGWTTPENVYGVVTQK